MVVAALISVWGSTVGVVIVVGVLWLLQGRGNNTDRFDRPGLSASWWSITALICLAGGVGGLVKGVWGAAALLIPAAFAIRKARTRAREGNI